MPDIQIKIANLPQIKAAFAKAPRLMATELNNAIRNSIKKIEFTSRENTPYDTGALRASHYMRFGSLRGEVGTNKEYDVFVHEGTYKMRARPYLRNAVRSNDSQVEMYFKNAVDKVLTEIGKQT